MTKWNRCPALFIALGVFGGPAACSEEPRRSDSSSDPECGDGDREDDEVCDGGDLDGATCESLGFGAGPLKCAPNCGEFDRSECGAPQTCGNGGKDGVELCDGADLAGTTCPALGYGEGTLACTANCANFDVSGCGAPQTCGSGEKDGVEACDGKDLGGATCESVGKDSGALACSPDCLSYDTSGCACTPVCGGLTCGPDPKCGVSCGECDGFSVCEAGACVKACDLAPITADTALDLDLKTVTLSGTITLNGAEMPDDVVNSSYPRGYLTLVDTTTKHVSYFSFGETGPVNYSFQVFAGTYDIYVESNASYEQSVLPSDQETVIAKGLAIMAPTTKDIDLKTVTLTGKVTLNGAVMPDDVVNSSYPRGYLKLLDTTTSHVSYFSFGETGPVNYSFQVFAGAYDIYVESNASYEQSVLPSDQEIRVQKGCSN